MTTTAPLLVFAIGNASRGDDALGPTVGAALREQGLFEDGRAELIEVYQLQVEDLLALQGRRGVLFVDAARDGATSGVSLRVVAPLEGAAAFTHALAPSALLSLYRRVLLSAPPPAWLLAIEGEDFELGAPLSSAARQRLDGALALAQDWLAAAPSASAELCS